MARPADPLFAGLVDDAALFPPGNAPMAQALAEHAAHRAGGYGDLIGPFLCPASRIDELVAALPAYQRIEIVLVNDVTDAAAAHARAVVLTMSSLAWVESRHDRLGEDPHAVSGGVRSGGPMAYLEVPRTNFDEALDLVNEQGPWHAAKYRTGGTTPDAFPSEVELAAFVLAVTTRRVPFKLTAGLHHAVRLRTDEGLEQHGVLNVLVAVRAAQTGSGDVAKVLAERDGDRLADEVRSWDEREVTDVRRSFRSLGCCGVTEPLDELRALGVIAGIDDKHVHDRHERVRA